MVEHESLTQKVFAPGNLVWGAHFINEYKFLVLASEGILPNAYTGKGFSMRPYSVCTAMLSNESRDVDKPLLNYHLATHFGPKEIGPDYPLCSGYSLPMALILSREKMIARYGENISAIGNNFRSHRYCSKQRSKYNCDGEYVNGIKISSPDPHAEDPFPDEVTINFPCPIDWSVKGVNCQLWEGTVVEQRAMPMVRSWLDSLNLNQIPVFSPSGLVLV
jgi:hypothetical protein